MNNQYTEFDQAPKAQRLPERKERRLTLNNLTEKQKGLITSAGFGVAGVSFGVVAMALMGTANPHSTPGHSDTNIDPPNPPGKGNETVDIKIHTDAPIADNVNDNMSFDQAFKAARIEVGAGGIFEWRGKLYNTYLKDEWDCMSSKDKADFYSSIDRSFLPGDENREKEILDIVNDRNLSDIDDHEDIVIIEEDNLQGSSDSVDEDVEIVIDDADDIIELNENETYDTPQHSINHLENGGDDLSNDEQENIQIFTDDV